MSDRRKNTLELLALQILQEQARSAHMGSADWEDEDFENGDADWEEAWEDDALEDDPPEDDPEEAEDWFLETGAASDTEDEEDFGDSPPVSSLPTVPQRGGCLSVVLLIVGVVVLLAGLAGLYV